jgi:hypothetical protein
MKFKRFEKCFWEYADNNGWLIFLGSKGGWHQFALANDPKRKVWCERQSHELADMLTEDEALIAQIK